MDRSTPYCGPAPGPENWALQWNMDPWLWSGLIAFAALCLWGRPVSRSAAGFALGGAVLAFASPLCALTVALFAARSLHHLLLICAVAPALALAWPRPGVPVGLALGGLGAALWAWHVPALYTAVWDNAGLYWLMQGALLLPGWLFWSAVFAPARISPVGHFLAIAGLAGQMGLIGAVLTFAPRVLYPEHLVGAEAFGLSALTDQQLSGLIMWVPGMVPLAVLAAMMMRRHVAGTLAS